jgi:endo-1,4-beta-xylanase
MFNYASITKNLFIFLVLTLESCFNGRAGVHAQSAEKQIIEQELLTKARGNIEKYRKGDAVLLITDSLGKPLPNLDVEITQVTQDFLFGNLSEEIFRLNPQDAARFQEKFTGLLILLN